MCIKQKTAWAFAGHNYDTELEAVKAAIDSMGKKLIKDHANNPGQGLIENDELPGLLLRYRELTATPEVASTESPEGTRSEELEGTRSEEPDPFDHPFDLPENEEKEAA